MVADGPQEQTQLINRRVVAVDGGTATGKGRLITELASLMRSKGTAVIHLSTGSLYRAVTYVSLQHTRQQVKGRRLLDASEVLEQAVSLLHDLPVAYMLELARERQIEMHGGVVWSEGKPMDVDGQLKSPGVGNGVSTVAGHLEVRQLVNRLTRLQVNEFDGYVLIDGRDIGHQVVPDASLKLLLTVSPEIAASRSQEHTMAEIIARDDADRRHQYGALKHADDPGEGVRVLATDEHTPESVRDHVYGLMCEVFDDLPRL
jgi:cytidylate kinase